MNNDYGGAGDLALWVQSGTFVVGETVSGAGAATLDIVYDRRGAAEAVTMTADDFYLVEYL